MRKFIITLIVLLFLFSLDVQAVTLDNDGSIRDSPYGDSKLPSSYEGIEYVDCYIPYKSTCGDIGGFATSASNAAHQVSTGGGTAMSLVVQNSIVGTTVMRESSYSYASSKGWALVRMSNPSGFSVSTDDISMNVISDANGNQYYMTAVQPFFFKHNKAGQGSFPANESGGFGEIVDVILTDGTCIHFVCFDINAAQHTNGVDNSGAGAFDYIYVNSKLNHPQYNNMFSTQNGNFLEVFGEGNSATVNFRSKYNIGSEEGKNKIAYYRMYGSYLKDSPKRAEGVGTEVSFSYGDVNISSGGTNGENGDESVTFKLPKEEDLVGMPEKSKLMDDIVNIYTVGSSSMNAREQYITSNLGNDIQMNSAMNFADKARTAVCFVGMLMIFYSIFLILASLFDTVNTFIDISMVGVFSMGMLEYTTDKEGYEAEGVLDKAKLIKVCIVLVGIGILLVSGGLFTWLSGFLIKMYNWVF